MITGNGTSNKVLDNSSILSYNYNIERSDLYVYLYKKYVRGTK